MRRGLGLLLALILLAGCGVTSSSNGVHWISQDERIERSVQLVVAPELVLADQKLANAIDWAAAQLGRSGYIAVHVSYDYSCSVGWHCVDLQRHDLGQYAGMAEWSWDTGLHMNGHAGTVTIDDADFDQTTMVLVMTHEACHAIFGLGHSPVEGVDGPCPNGQPSDYDLQLVADNHNHYDGGAAYEGDDSVTVTGTPDGGGRARAEDRLEDLAA